jgi:hypothetical protein
MQESTDIAAAEPLPVRRWTEHISWGATLALAWMLYEVTAKPNYGIVVACTKFGWNDFLTAHWLARRDPNRRRGYTCFFFYMASGVWKITVAAFLVTGLVLIITVILGERRPKGLFGLGALAIVGITSLAVIPALGVALARWYGVKVWIDSLVHESRRNDFWPPICGTANVAAGLLYPALIMPIVLTAVLTFRLGPWLMLMFLIAEGLLIWRYFRGVAAATPQECWGDHESIFVEDYAAEKANDVANSSALEPADNL